MGDQLCFMADKSKNKFTFKIILSYVILGILVFVAGSFIFTEITDYLSSRTTEKNDTKLLKTGALLTHIYEAESLSKLALQSKSKERFNAFNNKVDSILIELDTLKHYAESSYQKAQLDSVQSLLKQKVSNINSLRLLKVRSGKNNSLDKALKEFEKIEETYGKFSAENLFPSYKDLPKSTQGALKELTSILSDNVPKDSFSSQKNIDSVLNASRDLLSEAKEKDSKAQLSLELKEIELNRADLELSQKLRSIVSTYEQEILINTYNNTLQKEIALKRSKRLALIAAIAALLIVGFFTFLITSDYWKVQTYRQHLEKEKKFSESVLKSREQLISTVSHDLRTPLNTITGYADLMGDTALDKKQEGFVKQIKSATTYVTSLVNDLLDFSKLEAGKIEIQKIPFNLNEIISDTALNLKELYPNKPITLEVDIAPQLQQYIVGDPFRVRQILTNLITNAYKFTEEGSIKIEAKVIKETNGVLYTAIAVIDSGIGIAKDKQKAIFKEFTQAEKTTEKKYGGYGLGLTISKKLTELLGGTISVQSKVNQGSTFTIAIPFGITKEPIIPAKQEVAVANTQDLSVLIIDDDTAMLKMLKEVCQSLQIQAHIYSDFKEVSEHDSLKYDVVLTDIQMPNTSGFEVLEQLQKGSYLHYKKQPVIAMTGRKDLQTETYFNSGFSDVIQKPFTKDQLVNVLHKTSSKHINNTKASAVKEKSNTSHLFSLDIITSFLGDDKEAIYEVLTTFLRDTKDNMKRLDTAIFNGDYGTINQVTHKMLPMFRQLKAEDITPHLETLETITPEAATIKDIKNKHYKTIKNKTTALQLALEHYLATDLARNN